MTPHDVLNLVVDLQLLCLGLRESLGWTHSIARPWVPISFPLTHIFYLLPFLSYLAGFKIVSTRPVHLDMMINTALETTALLSDKNCKLIMEMSGSGAPLQCIILEL